MMKGGWFLPLVRTLVIRNLREIIRLTGAVVIIEVEVYGRGNNRGQG